MKKIGIIGGDLRIVKLAQMLAEEGFVVKTYALEKQEKEHIICCDTIEELVCDAHYIIGPIPLTSNQETINAPFYEQKVLIKEVFEKMKGKTLIAGSIKPEISQLAQENQIQIVDFLKREELAILNAISTAEGAIQIAINETSKTLHSANVLVMGFGRIGKILAKMLDGMGANVFCEARKNTDLAWIKAYGYHPIPIQELDNNLDKFEIIINTIPYVLIQEENIPRIKQDAIIIDLASAPGGVDKQAIKQTNIKYIWALSLPGKVAPTTSAEFIKETFYHIINEIEVK